MGGITVGGTGEEEKGHLYQDKATGMALTVETLALDDDLKLSAYSNKPHPTDTIFRRRATAAGSHSEEQVEFGNKMWIECLG